MLVIDICLCDYDGKALDVCPVGHGDDGRSVLVDFASC